MSKFYLSLKQDGQSGFSLVEVMISAGVMGVVALGMASMMSNMSKDQAALTEKFALLETQNSLLTTFSNPSICTSQLNVGPVDLTVPSPTITPSQLLMGALPTSPLIAKKGDPLPGFPAKKMVVSQIAVTNIVSSGIPNNYVGDLTVDIDTKTTIRSLKPAKLTLAFTVVPSPTLSSAVVTNCGFNNTGMGDWLAFAVDTSVQQAPSNGLLVVTSCDNCGVSINTAMPISGSCAGVPLVNRVFVSARDKYGQGKEAATIPVKQDECWNVEMTAVNQAPNGQNASSVLFRSL